MTEQAYLRRLTQEECDALPEGTQVVVTWTGGNGPHLYKIAGHHNGKALVDNCYRDALDFVGLEEFHTKVLIASL